MEDRRINPEEEQNKSAIHSTEDIGGVSNIDNREDTSNPVNSGGEPTIDTENKAAVAQTRSASSQIRGATTKKFITGSDSDGQL